MKALQILLMITALLYCATGCSKPAVRTAAFQVELVNAGDTGTILREIHKKQSPDVNFHIFERAQVSL